MPQAPDLYVNSTIDLATGDVAAFENLVGAHGGLGGWQDSAVLLAPAASAGLLPERIEGADMLHRVLVSMLEEMGIATEVDLARLLEASRAAQELLGRPLGAHSLVAGPVDWRR